MLAKLCSVDQAFVHFFSVPGGMLLIPGLFKHYCWAGRHFFPLHALIIIQYAIGLKSLIWFQAAVHFLFSSEPEDWSILQNFSSIVALPWGKIEGKGESFTTMHHPLVWIQLCQQKGMASGQDKDLSWYGLLVHNRYIFE